MPRLVSLEILVLPLHREVTGRFRLDRVLLRKEMGRAVDAALHQVTDSLVLQSIGPGEPAQRVQNERGGRLRIELRDLFGCQHPLPLALREHRLQPLHIFLHRSG